MNIEELNLEYKNKNIEKQMNEKRERHLEKVRQNIEKKELSKMLAEALELLTEKEQKVITLYYYEELTLKEISNVLEVSESRISQLHTRALQKMKAKMGPYMGILTNSV